MKIGLIGGSGLSDDNFFDNPVLVTTKYGSPSSRVFRGDINGNEIFYLKRHGRGHIYTPTNVPYRANIKALEQLGCEKIIAVTAVGSLRKEIEPGHIVFPDQFIDMTKNDNNNRGEALSVQQVADELGYINKRTVIANIKAGLITGYKQPGRNGKYFVYREDLEEFKDSLKVSVTDMAIA